MSGGFGYCPHCGNSITEPGPFCGNCGGSLAEPATAGRPGQAAHATQPTQSVPGGAAAPGAPPMQPQRNAPPEQPHRAAPVQPQPGRERPPSAGAPGAAQPASPPPPVEPPPAPADAAGEDAPRRVWLPYAAVGGAVVALAGIVAVLLVVLGGSAGRNVKSASATRKQALQLLAANGTTTVSAAAPGSYALVSAGKIAAIVPAGWRARGQSSGPTARAQFADPRSGGAAMTIVAEPAHGSDHGRAAAAVGALHHRHVAVRSDGAVELPGGRKIWRLVYTDSGLAHATYFFTACNGKTSVVVDAAAAPARFDGEKGTFQALAGGAEPLCS
jgi:hypothetical protein